MTKTKFIVYKAKDGYRWHATRKGRIVAESGEGYRKHLGLLKSLAMFSKSLASGAYTVDHPAKP
jgi:hypothetical protein